MEWDQAAGLDQNFDFISKINTSYGGNAAFKQSLLNNQCTLFASSVLYTGGIRDSRGDPYKHGRTSDYPGIPYWDISILMTGDWNSQGKNKNSYDGESWYNTPLFYEFTTQNTVGRSVLSYSYPPQRFQYGIRGGNNGGELGLKTLDWYHVLEENRSLIQKGDLVFYGMSSESSSFFHVAVIVGWGSATYFDAKPGYAPLPEDIARYYSCGPDYFLNPIVPEVVERSGAVNYMTYRSLDNTSQPIPYLEIVHITQ